MTIDEIQDAIVAEMSGLTEWMDKYEYLIKLGRQLKPFDDVLKTDTNQVQGCQSQVWVAAERIGDRLHLAATSDSLITLGIIALLLRVLDQQPADAVVNANLYFIGEVGLSTNLSPTRANGLALIVQKMKQHAKDLSG